MTGASPRPVKRPRAHRRASAKTLPALRAVAEGGEPNLRTPSGLGSSGPDQRPHHMSYTDPTNECGFSQDFSGSNAVQQHVSLVTPSVREGAFVTRTRTEPIRTEPSRPNSPEKPGIR